MKKENKILKATHEGKITIGKNELSVAVLEDGTRIITQSAVFKAFGRTKRGRAKDDLRVLNRPAFVDAKNLQPFIDEALDNVLTTISYKSINDNNSEGYNAEILPKLCKVYLDARDQKKLVRQQLPLARASEVLLIALSKVGITALVDEATGYQYDREKDELQKILKSYISEELLPWQKKFPDIFYKELFRLNGWDFTVRGIKKRPGVIGKWTKTLIYNELPKGVLDELEKNTPKNEKGHKSAQMHRLLTDDIGNPHLKAQINQMVTLFQLSDDMKHMWQQFEKLKLRQSGQLELPFSFDDKGHTIEPPIPIDETKLSNFNKKLKKGLDYNPKGKQ
jgi:P63C domain